MADLDKGPMTCSFPVSILIFYKNSNLPGHGDTEELFRFSKNKQKTNNKTWKAN